MHQPLKDDKGISFVAVLGILTFVLTAVGLIVSLAPQQYRKANFEIDRAFVLYSAESGLNHAIALADSALTEQGYESLNGWLQAAGTDCSLTLASDPDDISGAYIVTLEGRCDGNAGQGSLSDKIDVKSVGVFGSHRRTLSLQLFTASGPVFPRNVVATDPEDKYYLEGYEPVEVEVPEWDRGTVPNCENFISRSGVLENVDGCELHSWPSKLKKVINSTIHFIDSATPPDNFEATDSTFYVDRNLVMVGGKGGQLIGENRFYVLGELITGGNSSFKGQGSSLGESAPWNYFYVRDKLKLHGKTSIGSPTMPDIVFLTETTTLVSIDVESDGNTACYCAIYAPTRHVEFNGNAFTMIGAIVGETFTFNGGSGEKILYDHVANRLRGFILKNPSALTVTPRYWKEVYE